MHDLSWARPDRAGADPGPCRTLTELSCATALRFSARRARRSMEPADGAECHQSYARRHGSACRLRGVPSALNDGAEVVHQKNRNRSGQFLRGGVASGIAADCPRAITRAGSINAAIAEAQRLAHVPSLADSLAIGARLLSLVGDDEALGERVAQLVSVATGQGFPHWRAQGTIYRAWLKVKNGDAMEGKSLLRSGLTAYCASGAELYGPL
jgi:hypothetical protein